MKQYIWIFIILGSLVAGCAGSTRVIVRPDVPPLVGKTVAVLDFEYQPGEDIHEPFYGCLWTKNAGQIVAEQVSCALLECAEIKIVERARLREVFEEQKAWLSDMIKKGDYKEIGEVLGADYLIFGTVNEHCAIGITGVVRGFAAFSIRCVDVETGEVVWSTCVSGSSFYASPTSVSERLTKSIVSKLMKEFQKTRSRIRNKQ